MRIQILLAVILPLFTVTNTRAQSLPEEIAEKFFTDFETSGSSVALEQLYRTNEWMAQNSEAIENLKKNLGGLTEDIIGKYYGKVLIGKRDFSDTYVVMSYLIKYDRQPLRFTFHFYKPNDRWKIYSFEYDANFGDEMAEDISVPKE